MSLLGTQVFASPGKPCWTPAGGGGGGGPFVDLTVTNTLTVGGDASVGGNMVANYVYGETVEANLLTGQTLTLGGGGGQTGKGFFIDIGDSNTTVFSSAINSTSIVLFTRRGAPVPGPGKGPGQGTLVVDPASIVDGVSFRVDLVDANGVIVAASNVVAEFDWFIINTS